jgi:hypothetical protein
MRSDDATAWVNVVVGGRLVVGGVAEEIVNRLGWRRRWCESFDLEPSTADPVGLRGCG